LNDAEFNNPRGIAFDQDGILYVADRNNHCVRAINRQGIVSTVAGVPRQWGTADGDPTTAGFDNPYMVTVDIEGNIWIGEDSNNRMLRKLTIE
jgi:sugar lactone lactonase YvrE